MLLRPYQSEIARAVLVSIENNLGLTFSVEIARQGGKNELSAHLEVLLLTMFMSAGEALLNALRPSNRKPLYQCHVLNRGWMILVTKGYG
jgi:hypothetical protein